MNPTTYRYPEMIYDPDFYLCHVDPEDEFGMDSDDGFGLDEDDYAFSDGMTDDD